MEQEQSDTEEVEGFLHLFLFIYLTGPSQNNFFEWCNPVEILLACTHAEGLEELFFPINFKFKISGGREREGPECMHTQAKENEYLHVCM